MPEITAEDAQWVRQRVAAILTLVLEARSSLAVDAIEKQIDELASVDLPLPNDVAPADAARLAAGILQGRIGVMTEAFAHAFLVISLAHDAPELRGPVTAAEVLQNLALNWASSIES